LEWGLYKIGFLLAKYSWRTYVGRVFRIAVLSTHLCHRHVEGFTRNQFNFITAEIWRVSTVRDIEADFRNRDAIHSDAFIKSNLLRGVKTALAAVGQMALTITSLRAWSCQWLFMWSSWALYGKLTYLQHHLLMSCIWVLNIAASLLWLRSFQYGPLEWVWRSLTYWKLSRCDATAHRLAMNRQRPYRRRIHH